MPVQTHLASATLHGKPSREGRICGQMREWDARRRSGSATRKPADFGPRKLRRPGSRDEGKKSPSNVSLLLAQRRQADKFSFRYFLDAVYYCGNNLLMGTSTAAVRSGF